MSADRSCAHYTIRYTSPSIPNGLGAVIQSAMADDAAIRLANFRAYFGDDFSPTTCAKLLWGTPSLWSNLYHGRKSFGEKIARRIEERLGLARMSLDDPDGPSAAPLSADLLQKLLAAPEDERRRLENMLRAHFGMPMLEAPVVAPGKQRLRAA